MTKVKIIRIASQLLIIIAIGAAAIFLTSIFTGNKTSSKEEIAQEIIKEVVLKKPSCPNTSDSFISLKETGQIVTLVKNHNSYGENGYFVNPKVTVVKSLGSSSQIACGYLYIKAHTNQGKSLQLTWEHPYIKPGQFGGHIDVSESIIPYSNSESNEFLFNLSDIKYREKNTSSELMKADWAALLNVSDRIEFILALNTAHKTGTLEEVSIVYQCWSPETGQITHDCKLTTES